MANLLEAEHFTVVSRWHCGSEPHVERRDPTNREQRGVILCENLAHLERADILVVLGNTGGAPRATFAEAGFALARSKPVVWLQGAGGVGACIFDAHGLVTILVDPTVREVAAELRAAALRHLTRALA
jgi:nucleoside 2-deoxyribosyltransferase